MAPTTRSDGVDGSRRVVNEFMLAPLKWAEGAASAAWSVRLADFGRGIVTAVSSIAEALIHGPPPTEVEALYAPRLAEAKLLALALPEGPHWPIAGGLDSLELSSFEPVILRAISAASPAFAAAVALSMH